MTIVHKSIMTKEILDFFKPDNGPALFIDGTMGEGGHSESFLETYASCRVIGLDADAEIQKKAKERLGRFGDRVSFRNVWFDDYFENYNEEEKPDRVLLDLGISMFHYKESGRGFSFDKDEPLDMRLDGTRGDSAADLVNSLSEKDLADLIYEYSDERLSRKIARFIVEERKEEIIATSKQLADIVWRSVPPSYRYGRLHPATRTFQALRIAVNRELERLPKALGAILKVLNPGGRLAVISFHSHEDRIVKNLFKQWALSGSDVSSVSTGAGNPGNGAFFLLTKKPVVPSAEEQESNPASRSAKLRVIGKGVSV